jgi:hypothetical protein
MAGSQRAVRRFSPALKRLGQSFKSKEDLLRDPLCLPKTKAVQSLAHQNTNAHGAGDIDWMSFMAGLNEYVYTRLKLI